MRLDLQAPSGWQVRRRGDGFVAYAPPGVRARLVWSPLALASTVPAAALERAVTAELPPGARVEELQRTRGETGTGWPLLLVDLWVLRGAEVVELRLAALYQFRALAAHALLCVRDERLFFGVRQECMPGLVAARPDFRGALSCIAQFWDEPPSEPEAIDDLSADTW
jgi:hypothetical protein